MQNVFRRPPAAPPIVPISDNDNDKSGNNGNDDANSLESLDSLCSSKSMESLETLPPFSPFASFKSPGGGRQRSWRKSARSSVASSFGNSSMRSIGSDYSNDGSIVGNTKNGVSESVNTGRSSKPFRMPTAKLFSSSPKRLFKSSTPAPFSMPPENEENADPSLSRQEEKMRTQVLTTPLLPPSTIKQQGTQLLSPLTPFTVATTINKDTTAFETTLVASNSSTPITSNNNNYTSNALPKVEGSDPTDHLQQPVTGNDTPASKDPLEEGSTQGTKSKNDAELQVVHSALLDSLQRNMKKAPHLLETSWTASGETLPHLNTSVNTSADSKNDSGYAEFLNIISSGNESVADQAKSNADELLAEHPVLGPNEQLESNIVEDKALEEYVVEDEDVPLEEDGVEDVHKSLEEVTVEHIDKPLEDTIVEHTVKTVEQIDKPLEDTIMEHTVKPLEGNVMEHIVSNGYFAPDETSPSNEIGRAESMEESISDELLRDSPGKSNLSVNAVTQDDPSDFSSDDCHCLWCPEPLLNMFRGFNANPNAITSLSPGEPDQQQGYMHIDNSNNNNNDDDMQQSVESLRTDLKAMMDQHAHDISSMDADSINLILSETRTIRRSLDRISTLSVNSMGG